MGKRLKSQYRRLARLFFQTGICKNRLADFSQHFCYLTIAGILYLTDAVL